MQLWRERHCDHRLHRTYVVTVRNYNVATEEELNHDEFVRLALRHQILCPEQD